MTDPVPVAPTSPYTTTTTPVGSPFDRIHPPSTSPKITALWLRFDYDQFADMGGFALPDLSDARYGPALSNLFGGYAGAYYSYEGEYDWVTAGPNPSGVTPGAFPSNLHDQWRRNGLRFFTEVSHEGALSRDLPPSQPRSVSLPDQGMIKVTAPLDREIPVNITYSGDWRVGATRFPTTSIPTTPLVRRDFFHVTFTALYRSVFAPSGDTSDWNSSTHSALWSTRRPDYRSLIWYGSRTIEAGVSGVTADIGASHTENITINTWDTVQPGETVHYWMARWIPSNKFFMPTHSSGSQWGPVDGTVDMYGNAAWAPAYDWQFNSATASGATPNTASWTYPGWYGQGFTNRASVDSYPSDLPTYATRSHCFQVVTF